MVFKLKFKDGKRDGEEDKRKNRLTESKVDRPEAKCHLCSWQLGTT
jgi:hypothetical protein